MSHDYQVLHLGRMVFEWRAIVGCLRNSAKIAATRGQQDELNRMASEIESQLPVSSAKELPNG